MIKISAPLLNRFQRKAFGMVLMCGTHVERVNSLYNRVALALGENGFAENNATHLRNGIWCCGRNGMVTGEQVTIILT